MAKKAIFPRMRIFKEIKELTAEIPVAQIMKADLKTLREGSSVEEAIQQMARFSLSSAIVINSRNEPIGLLTTGDLIKKVVAKGLDPEDLPLEKVMVKDPESILPTLSIGEAGKLMETRRIRRLPVVNEKRQLVGVITSTDLALEINHIYEENQRLLWNAGLINLLFMMLGAILVLLVANILVNLNIIG